MDGGQRLPQDGASRKHKQPTQAARANADGDNSAADEDVASAGRDPRDHAAGSLAPRRSRVRRGLRSVGGTEKEWREGQRGVTSGGGPAWISRVVAAGAVPWPGCAEFGTGRMRQPRLTRSIRSCRRLLRHMPIYTTHIMLRMALFQRSHLHRWGMPRLHHSVTPPQLPTARPLLLFPCYPKRHRPFVRRTRHRCTPIRTVRYLLARGRGSTLVSQRDVLGNLPSAARTAPQAHSVTS